MFVNFPKPNCFLWLKSRCSRQVHVLADTDIALARAQHSLHTGPAALQATSHYMYSITQALQHYRPQAIIILYTRIYTGPLAIQTPCYTASDRE